MLTPGKGLVGSTPLHVTKLCARRSLMLRFVLQLIWKAVANGFAQPEYASKAARLLSTASLMKPLCACANGAERYSAFTNHQPHFSDLSQPERERPPLPTDPPQEGR